MIHLRFLQDDLDTSVLNDTSYRRSWDDLCMYKQFFSELFEFDVRAHLFTVLTKVNFFKQGYLSPCVQMSL